MGTRERQSQANRKSFGRSGSSALARTLPFSGAGQTHTGRRQWARVLGGFPGDCLPGVVSLDGERWGTEWFGFGWRPVGLDVWRPSRCPISRDWVGCRAVFDRRLRRPRRRPGLLAGLSAGSNAGSALSSLPPATGTGSATAASSQAGAAAPTAGLAEGTAPSAGLGAAGVSPGGVSASSGAGGAASSAGGSAAPGAMMVPPPGMGAPAAPVAAGTGAGSPGAPVMPAGNAGSSSNAVGGAGAAPSSAGSNGAMLVPASVVAGGNAGWVSVNGRTRRSWRAQKRWRLSFVGTAMVRSTRALIGGRDFPERIWWGHGMCGDLQRGVRLYPLGGFLAEIGTVLGADQLADNGFAILGLAAKIPPR